MKTQKATTFDIADVVKISHKLWVKKSTLDLTLMYQSLLEKEDAQIFLLYLQGEVIGFAQAQLRYDYVEGTSTSPVGYLEGLFIQHNHRNKRFAQRLLSDVEKWLVEKKCTVIASDSHINNLESYNFHIANGFHEENRIICYTKKLM